MGKKRIAQLLDQLQNNQHQELQNAAAIFTVAQAAVNVLREQDSAETPSEIAALLPATSPSAPLSLSKADLLQQYGSHRGCRKAAKEKGIRFRRTPSWDQLIAAFSYVEACRHAVEVYLDAFPNPNLNGITIEVKLN